MKKIVLSIILLLSLMIVVTGCDKEKQQTKNIAEDKKTIELFDEGLGVKTTFKYDSKENYSDVKEESGGASKAISFKNEDLNLSFEMYYNNMREATYNSSKEGRSSQKYYKEYKFGKYNGYAYGNYDDELYLNIILNKDDNNDVVVLFVSINTLNNDDTIVSDVVADKKVQELFNSMNVELSK